MKKRRLFLVDGSAYCYRAFYAIRELATRAGEPTNAVYGFVTTINKLLEDEAPEYLAVCFDHSRKTFRQEKFADYKIHRKPMPDLLAAQLPVIREVLEALQISTFVAPGFEADDLLATIAHQAVQASKDLEVIIVTPDKDALQLVGDRVRVLDAPREGTLYDEAQVKARFGVEPRRIADWMALSGDASDNIPGVPGIGPKMATALLSEFGSLEQLLEHVEQVPKPGARRILQEHKEMAVLSKDLARLNDEVPIAFELEALRLKGPKTDALAALYKRLEFRSLLSKIQGPPRACAPCESIGSKADFIVFLKEAGRIGRLFFELGLGEEGKVEAVGLCLREKKTAVRLNPSAEELRSLFEAGAVEKGAHDAKRAFRALRAMGITPAGIVFDTMLAAYLLDPDRKSEDLSDLCLDYLGRPCPKAEPGESGGLGERALLIGQLREKLEKELKEKELDGLFKTIELPLAGVLADMEARGVGLDAPFLRGLSKEMDGKLQALGKKILAHAGCEFNINSPRQLAEVLFIKLKLPVIKRTKTGPSTDVEVLEALKDAHPIAGLMLQYRELAKLKSTYVDALPELVDPSTGRLHCTFHQTGTATGRLSTSDPNLQNIPIKTEEGRRIRRAFIADRPGDRILSADYSQIELRLLAHLSGDEALTAAFQEGRDVHRMTAAEIFGVSEAQVDGGMRQAAKTVNFGIIYGMSPYGLSRELGIPPEDAGRFIAAVFKRYPRVESFIQEQKGRAKKLGYVTTLLNRRRYIPQLLSDNQAVREFGERIAVNAPIQGSAADLIKRAMIDIDGAMAGGRFSSAMVLQIHDELVFETAAKEEAELTALVRERMEGVWKLSVPLTVRIRIGKNWLETEEV